MRYLFLALLMLGSTSAFAINPKYEYCLNQVHELSSVGAKTERTHNYEANDKGFGYGIFMQTMDCSVSVSIYDLNNNRPMTEGMLARSLLEYSPTFKNERAMVFNANELPVYMLYSDVVSPEHFTKDSVAVTTYNNNYLKVRLTCSNVVTRDKERSFLFPQDYVDKLNALNEADYEWNQDKMRGMTIRILEDIKPKLDSCMK